MQFRGVAFNGQKVVLAAIIIGLIAALWLIGPYLGPIIAAVIIAYIFDGVALDMRDRGMPPTAIASILTLVFLALLTAAFFMAGPLLASQLVAFAQSLPSLAAELQAMILAFARENASFIDEDDVASMLRDMNQRAVAIGQNMIVYSLELLPTLANALMYVIVTPLMLFFMIRDRETILAWGRSFLPKDRGMAEVVWSQLSLRFGAYLRAKAYHVLIIGGISYAGFTLLEINFAALLAVISGLSTLVPYFGAPAAALPVALVAWSQWGVTSDEFFWALVVYTVIQTIDGAVIATILLAHSVRLHPIAVMAAVLVAGQLLGFIGLVFAIPMASALEVIIDAWREGRETHRQDEGRTAPAVIATAAE